MVWSDAIGTNPTLIPFTGMQRSGGLRDRTQSVLPIMRKQRLLYLQPAALERPSPNPKQTRLKVEWMEAVAIPVEIWRLRLQVAMQMHFIYSKFGSGQGHAMPFAFPAHTQINFASKPGRRQN